MGDIAVPHNNDVILNDGGIFSDKVTVANLEGALVEDTFISNRGLYNDKQVRSFLQKLNVKAVSLANNHIQDIPQNFEYTQDFLKKEGIEYFGAGKDRKEASSEVYINYEDVEYCLLGYAWSVTGLRNRSSSVNVSELICNRVVEDIQRIKNRNVYIICFFHWGYELEIFPLPMDRKIAMRAIDAGANAIVGCHSHCVQGIELYKGKPIVYGLGNFFVPDGYYFGSNLCYPDISHNELAFEIGKDGFKCHWFYYDVKGKMITYKKTTEIDSEEVIQVTPYHGMAAKDYFSWFVKNRRKKLLLPIFNDTDQGIVNTIGIEWVKLRQLIIMLTVRIGIKKAPK